MTVTLVSVREIFTNMIDKKYDKGINEHGIYINKKPVVLNTV